jgi:biopolymer transport protein ExbD
MHELKSDVNVTPLVDVCLVLLIIFMVVTPLISNQQDVSLPQTSSPQSLPEEQRQITLILRADGGVRVGERRIDVDEAELVQILASIHTATPDRPVVIKADRHRPYREVRRLTQLAHDAQIRRVGLVTERATP